MTQNIIALIAVVAPLVSVILATLYAYVGIQNHKIVNKDEYAKLMYCVVDAGVTMDDRNIFTCNVNFAED